jgi:hypothetical protein
VVAEGHTDVKCCRESCIRVGPFDNGSLKVKELERGEGVGGLVILNDYVHVLAVCHGVIRPESNVPASFA